MPAPSASDEPRPEPKHKPDPLTLALEYLDLAEAHPVKIKTVVFHVRRMIRDQLVEYQLLDDCVGAAALQEVRAVVERARAYQASGDFRFDPDKERRAKEALERRKREEGKRKVCMHISSHTIM